MTKYFGFAMSSSMFSIEGQINHRFLTPEEVKEMESKLTPCLNPSHQATIAAMRERFGIDVAIPTAPPKVTLGRGDSLIVMSVRGLPRLTDRHEYTDAEIAEATFVFQEFTVL